MSVFVFYAEGGFVEVGLTVGNVHIVYHDVAAVLKGLYYFVDVFLSALRLHFDRAVVEICYTVEGGGILRPIAKADTLNSAFEEKVFSDNLTFICDTGHLSYFFLNRCLLRLGLSSCAHQEDQSFRESASASHLWRPL